MTNKTFDNKETTVVYDYNDKTVEFYSTHRAPFDNLIKRNPNFLVKEELEPGFRIVYPFSEVRQPHTLTMVKHSSGDA